MTPVDDLAPAALIALVRDERAFDLDRIDALKLLAVTEVPGAKDAIIDMMLGSRDDDVRDFAAIAAASYMSDPNVARAIERIVLDRAQRSNLRWNAFAAIKRGPRNAAAKAILKQLASEAEFATSATRVIGEWARAKPKPKPKPKR